MNKTHLGLILELILFLIIFIFSIHPVENFDFWFHIKYGEYILNTKQLPFTDQFSHTAYGSPAIPYEWLFQVIIYPIFTIFGNVGVSTLVALLVLAYSIIFRQILWEIFKVPLIPRLFLVGFIFVLGYDFWVERPQSVAYVLFMAVLYLVLKKVFLEKPSLSSPRKWGSINKWLLLTIPIFFIWTNLHASMILGLYLFFSFAIICWMKAYFKTVIPAKAGIHLTETANWIPASAGMTRTARDLFIFGTINTIITLLPPLGTKTYQLLYLFFEKREFISVVISEWVPLYKLQIRFYIYLGIMLLAGLSLIWAFLKKTKHPSVIARNLDLFYFLPFIPLGLFVISGVRQTQFSLPVILLSLVPAIQILKERLKLSITIITIIIIIIFILFLSSLYFYRQEVSSVLRLYPNQAIPFIKANLKGNMFNEYHMGGYLLYKLGPEIKTFIDGRTDMFLPQVLPEYYKLTYDYHNNFEDSDFKNYFNFLVSKYDVSWAILTTERWTPIRRLARLLREDPSWHLVFFDDKADIYVRDDGKNSGVIDNFEIKAATPFGKSLYKQSLPLRGKQRLPSDDGKEGQREEAKNEYRRMQQISPSAISLNALGFMLLEDQKYEEAKKLFNQALTIDPKASAPKMNLAELAVKDGDLDQAIRLYRQALRDDTERGLVYLRLGQLIIQSGGSKEEAKKVWQKGLTKTPDEEILSKLRKELTE